jgi:hypothetical protein
MNSHKSFIPNVRLNTPLADIHYPKEKIHNRISYRFWREITKIIGSKGLSNEEKVRSMHLILNERLMFNTEKQAGFDAESAEQAILDIL